MQSWFELPEPQVKWLVDGLVPADGYSAIVGKPKSGKSTFIRNLVSGVIRGTKFLDRVIDIPPNTGRVLYLHLDRKDQPWRVAKELRQLGISKEDSARLILRTAEDLTAETFADRLEWLKKEIGAAKPHLVVIDLLWQFVVVQNANDYNATLTAINALQDALREMKYAGALVVAMHGRKATNPVDPFDDLLGSTGQRGSFATIVMLTHRRGDRMSVYTVASDQTQRDDLLGELPETIITKNADGTLQLGETFGELAKLEKKSKFETSLKSLVLYIEDHPGAEMESLVRDLRMSKKRILDLLKETDAFVKRMGTGVKSDPYRYFPIKAGEKAA